MNQIAPQQRGWLIGPSSEPLDPQLVSRLAVLAPADLGHHELTRAVGGGIRHIAGASRWCGTALTLSMQVPDSLILQRALEDAVPGTVLVVDAGAELTQAPVGEMVARRAGQVGCVAIIINGACTDLEELEELDLPVYAHCTSAKTTQWLGTELGTLHLPVRCGTTLIADGDILVGDRNGVVSIARGDATLVTELAEHLTELESDLRVRIAEGRDIDPTGKFARLVPPSAKLVVDHSV
jgi:4-hydroxy-4-methyl-2-oxoglutarate aldolase